MGELVIRTTTNELYHHGIIGQKWGVRRYQNADGSYTAAGRRRYALDRDVNDKTRTNIAKIRTGEAKRRLDVAKKNNETNTVRLAELQGRVKSAKRNERLAKRIEKGAALEAKGRTIIGNSSRTAAVTLAAVMGSNAFTHFLNSRITTLGNSGRLHAGHIAVSKMLNDIGKVAAVSIIAAYGLKSKSDSAALRSWYSARSSGKSTTKAIGSQEYADRVARQQQKK